MYPCGCVPRVDRSIHPSIVIRSQSIHASAFDRRPTPPTKRTNTHTHTSTGGASACFASTIIHPIDLAKVRLQLYSTLNPGAERPGAVSVIVNLVKQDGVAAAYAGLSASIMRQAIYGTARIGLHRTFSDML